MGFYSGKCKGCGLSIISKSAISKKLDSYGAADLTNMVLIKEDLLAKGIYGGYGDLETRSGSVIEEIFHGKGDAAYHNICWQLAGNPVWENDPTPSDDASDQGWFLDDDEYIPILEKIREKAVNSGLRIAKGRKSKFNNC